MNQILGRYSEQIYALMRIVTGLLFSCHGAMKLFGWFSDKPGQTATLFSLMGMAGVIEFFGGLLIALGLLASYAAFLASGMMAVAYFTQHYPRGFWPIKSGGELAALYFFVFLFISAEGSRRRSVGSGLMRAGKLEVSIDAAGNLIGRRAGRERNLPPLLFGSHIDSVPEGGNYDGDVGSLGAIEVAQTLAENSITLRHPLEVIIFQNEEGGLIGSRAISGELTEKELDLVSRSGKTIREGINFIGGDTTKLSDVKRSKGSIAAYLELHIEQGGILEAEQIDIGVVEGI